MSAELKMRVQQLEKFLLLLNETEILIKYRALRTAEIISELSERDNFSDFDFINNLKQKLTGENDNISVCWQNSVNETKFLSEKDKRIFSGVGEQLGTTDISGQISMIELNKKLLEENLSEARTELTEKGKLSRPVWGLAGIAIGILII